MSKLSNKEYISQIYEDTYVYISKYLIVKCRRTEDVPDMLQTVYMNFMTRVEKFGQAHILIPKHYLLRIAKDELLKSYKANNAQNQKDSIEDMQEEYEIIEENFLMEDIVENKILYDSAWSAIKDLDDLTVKIFILRFKYDMQLNEISKKTGLSMSNVKNRLYRGFSKLKCLMEVSS